ncbi:ClpP/crotonase [Xylaria sp. FL1042]|nr:ClpP/crotonase [Xylaria sp. FL1042]
MPLRPTLRLIAPSIRLVRPYSSTSDAAGPLITVSNLRAAGSGHIRVLELNRPAARNAISKALLAALRAEIDDVHAQYTREGDEKPITPRFGGAAGVDQKGPTRALVLASAVDASFCAGADLKERRGFTQEETAQFLADLRATFSLLSKLPIPTISAISSMALGGGLELALCTHFRVLASTAVVGLPETRLGIIPGAGGTYRLPALIGLPRARDLILTGRRVAAPEAYFLGLADRLVEVLPEEEEEGGKEGEKNQGAESKGQEGILRKARRAALAEAVRLAGEICEGGPIAIRAGLQAVEWAREDVEDAMYKRVVNSEDRDEALQAFKEKRKPVFKGR